MVSCELTGTEPRDFPRAAERGESAPLRQPPCTAALVVVMKTGNHLPALILLEGEGGRRKVEAAFPRINCISEVVGKPSPAYGHFWLRYCGT